METAPSAEVIRATQDSLGKFVKRPPLTEKLLKKPPFRFLHDIITSVLKNNGLFEGLFEESELISENVKDRERKILFLTKVITVLNMTTGKTLTVKPSKIISGQEPEKTNEMLQCLGYILEQNFTTEEAVKSYTQNFKNKSRDESIKKPPKPDKKPKDDLTLNSKSNEKFKKQNEKKESTLNKNDVSKKDKRESSTSRKDTQRNQRDTSKSRRDNSVSRKDSQKDKMETLKDDKTKSRDRSVTKQRSTEQSSKTLPPKQNLTDKNTINRSNTKIIEADKKSEDNNSEENQPELVSKESNLKSDNDIIDAPKNTELIYQEDNKKLSEAKIVVNGVQPDYDNGNNDIHPLLKPITENRNLDSAGNNSAAAAVNNHVPENNISESVKTDYDKDNSITKEKITPLVPAKKNDIIDTKPAPVSEIYNNFTLKNQEPSFDTLTDKSSESIHNVDKNKSATPVNKPSTPMVSSRSNFLRPPSARPPSARPGAPRLRDKLDNVISATEASPVGKVHVIVENAEMDAEDEEASLVFVEAQIEQEDDSGAKKVLKDSSAEHGHLVQQILNSQKEFSQMQTGKTEIEWEFGVQRAREASSQETEQLRFNLQALSRAANPLGKLLDHIQEDVEVMRQELQQWTKIYEDANTQLAKEKSGTEQAIQPLQAKTKQLDEEIADKRDKINDLKSIIHKNTTRINKLLASGNVQ